jgi:hypothetical protein
VLTISVTLLLFGGAHAQESVVGRYTGHFEPAVMKGSGSPPPVGMTLQIESVENGQVKAVATHSGDRCGGTYTMAGAVVEGKLKLRATHKGGRAGDCGLSMTLSVEGPKLVGNLGDGSPVTLTRR